MSARASSSAKPTAPIPPLTISPHAIVSEKAVLTGSYAISIAAGSVIHPFARLDSSAGPIAIEQDVVVWEKATIGGAESGSSAEIDSAALDRSRGIFIDRSASIHPMAQIAPGVRIGAFASIGVNAIVHAATNIGAYATLSPFVQIEAAQTVKDHTTVFLMGEQTVQRQGVLGDTDTNPDAQRWRDLVEEGHDREIKMLRRLVKGGAKWIGNHGA